MKIFISDSHHVNIADACIKCYLYLSAFTLIEWMYYNVFLLSSWNHKKITKVLATAANVKNIMSLIFISFFRYILIPSRLCMLNHLHVYSYILWFGHQRYEKFCLRHEFLKEGIHIYIQWWYWGFFMLKAIQLLEWKFIFFFSRWHQVRFCSYWDDKI